jgi:hypothetical protein
MSTFQLLGLKTFSDCAFYAIRNLTQSKRNFNICSRFRILIEYRSYYTQSSTFNLHYESQKELDEYSECVSAFVYPK